MNNREKLLNKYKNIFIPNEKNPIEIISDLKKRLDLVDMDISTLGDFYLKQVIYNITNAPHFNDTDVFNFTAYEIVKNEKSFSYWNHRYIPIDIGDDRIFVLIEENTKYCNSNSIKLFFELTIDRGVNKSSENKDSLELINYLSILDKYENQEY